MKYELGVYFEELLESGVSGVQTIVLRANNFVLRTFFRCPSTHCKLSIINCQLSIILLQSYDIGDGRCMVIDGYQGLSVIIDD